MFQLRLGIMQKGHWLSEAAAMFMWIDVVFLCNVGLSDPPNREIEQ